MNIFNDIIPDKVNKIFNITQKPGFLFAFKNLINKTIPCLQTLEGKLVKPHLNIINQKNNSNESIKSDSFGLYLINRVLI